MMRFLFILLAAFSLHASAYNAIPCPTPQANDVVIIVAGQSNAGSYGDVAHYQANSDVQLWFGTGTCYPLADGLAGFSPPPGGGGGSIWTRFASIYHAANPAGGRIVLVDIANNGVPIQNWRQAGPDYPRIAMAVGALAVKGWSPRVMLFMGGETDAMAPYGSQAATTASLLSMVDGMRANGYTFPVFVGLSTTCRFKLNGTDAGVDFNLLTRAEAAARLAKQFDIQTGILNAVDASRGLHIGVNTDLLGGAARWDRCHLNDYGQWVAAQMWFDMLTLTELLP